MSTVARQIFAILIIFTPFAAQADCSAYGPTDCSPLCDSSCTYGSCVDSSQSPFITIFTIPTQWQAMTDNCSSTTGTLNTLNAVDASQTSRVFSDGTWVNQSTLPTQVHLAHTADPNDVSSAPRYYCATLTKVSSVHCPVNGVCGSANGGSFDNAPSGAALCATGDPSGVDGSGPWQWACNGLNGGGPATCNAAKNAPASSCTCQHWNPAASNADQCNTHQPDNDFFTVPATDLASCQAQSYDAQCSEGNQTHTDGLDCQWSGPVSTCTYNIVTLGDYYASQNGPSSSNPGWAVHGNPWAFVPVSVPHITRVRFKVPSSNAQLYTMAVHDGGGWHRLSGAHTEANSGMSPMCESIIVAQGYISDWTTFSDTTIDALLFWGKGKWDDQAHIVIEGEQATNCTGAVVAGTAPNGGPVQNCNDGHNKPYGYNNNMWWGFNPGGTNYP